MLVESYDPIIDLQSCNVKKDLRSGRTIHAKIIESRKESDMHIMNALINMYRKCGSLLYARNIFDQIEEPNVVSWNTLILGYAENGEGCISLNLFAKMVADGFTPSSLTYVAALKACTSLAANGDGKLKLDCLERGREIHTQSTYHLNLYVRSALVDMYATCGCMLEAHRVFNSIEKPDVVVWTALILGYAENGQGHVSLDLFSSMKRSGLAPNTYTYVAVIKACAFIGALAIGRKLHAEMNVFDAHVITCLVDFYGKCGSMLEAREVFEVHSKLRNVTTWTALLGGYSRIGDSDSAFRTFDAMQDDGLRPDAVTFLCLLLCCSHAGLVDKAREYFEAMPTYGVSPTIVHYTCMVDVLGRRNQLDQAIRMIREMCCRPNSVIWMTLLAACRKWKNSEIGKEAFNALVDMEGKTSSHYVLMANIYGID